MCRIQISYNTDTIINGLEYVDAIQGEFIDRKHPP